MLFLTVVLSLGTAAQRTCQSFEYEQAALQLDPVLKVKQQELEQFIQRQLKSNHTLEQARFNGYPKIIIPVVVHIVYNQQAENISDEQVYNQIAVLNNCFRRMSADTNKTPARFLGLAADCEIEFQLAVSDSKKRATTGIIRKYSPVTQWNADDNVKYSSMAGDDAWDASSYLNIWVCNLRRSAGYGSFPGGPAEKDGLVINYNCFGFTTNTGFDLGKTVVHEVGHWLGLRHIWGDSFCGDDWVDDTPKQSSFNGGCPTGIKITCANAPDGDMYMNYMDLTSDACTNLFTNGQKARMLASFAPGGSRYAMNSSTGLNKPTNFEIPLPDELPKWYQPQLYPNPATTEIILDISYDIRWLGALLTVSNVQGQAVIRENISAKIQRIDISRLRPGIYFIQSKKADGATIKSKFIKM